MASHLKTVYTYTQPIAEFVSNWFSLLQEALTSKKKPVETELSAVIYTDGGCRPGGRGIGGWGIHGYIYHDDEPKQGHGCKDLTTSKGYLEKTAHGAKKITVVKYIDGCGSIIPESTNNEAELEALYRALLTAVRCQIKRLHLILDSEYALKGATDRLDTWVSNGWLRADGTPVANVARWTKIYEALKELRAANVEITWQWIKGHSDALGNVLADSNATRGVVAGRKGMSLSDMRLSDTEKYWKPEVDRHVFISEPRWYFKTNVGQSFMSPTGQWTYHLGKHDDDEQFGKKAADSNYAVIQLSKPCDTLEMIRSFQESIEPSLFNTVVVARLDNLFNPRVYADIRNNETTYLQRIGPKVDVFSHEEMPLTTELRPARLAFNALEELAFLERILNSVRTNHLNGYCLSNINDYLYESVESKKKTTRKLKLEQDAAALTVDVDYDVGQGTQKCPVTLTLGIDIPKRNTLSALAETDAEVFVITWKESEVAFRYATIIKMGDDLGIWAGVYSNLRVIP
jgi:ribonuclease HI